MSGKKTDKSMIELGARIRKVREDAGLSQGQTAALLAVSYKTIARMESGLIRSVKNLNLAKKIEEMGAAHWRERWNTHRTQREVESAQMDAPSASREPTPAPARKASLPRGQHNNRPCPVCGVVTKAPRYRYLCKKHRTPENMAKFARKAGAPVVNGSLDTRVTEALPSPATTPLPGWLDGRPTDLEVALNKMERMRDMFAGMKPPTVAPAPAPSSSVAISKGVVLLALNTLKEETKFAGLAELALAALEDL